MNHSHARHTLDASVFERIKLSVFFDSVDVARASYIVTVGNRPVDTVSKDKHILGNVLPLNFRDFEEVRIDTYCTTPNFGCRIIQISSPLSPYNYHDIMNKRKTKRVVKVNYILRNI